MPKQRIDVLIIDGQYDFCNPNGALFVPGADEDMVRLAGLIDKLGIEISNINMTLDSHHLIDCSHPLYWRNSSGQHPDPFTTISAEDVRSGKWGPIYPSETKDMIKYEEDLESNGRYAHTIWPAHCLIGSDGQKIDNHLYEAVLRWQEKKRKNVNYKTKGSNRHREHYSAVKAEVEWPGDPTTQIDTSFIEAMEDADIIIGAGEAGSHCTKFTMEDISVLWPDYIKKFVLLTDAISPVGLPEYKKEQENMFKEMESKGAKLTTTKDFVA